MILGIRLSPGPDQRVAGIVSERHIIRVLAECGPATLERPVGQVMTHTVATCRPAETMSGVMEQTMAAKFRHLPVVQENRLIGVVSIGDVVK